MLNNAIRRRALYQLWLREHKISFGLALALSAQFSLRELAPLRDLLAGWDLQGSGDGVLHQCSSLDDENSDALRAGLRIDAEELLNRLKSFGGVNHQLLAAKGLSLLLDSHLSFERFLHWAERVSPVLEEKACSRAPVWNKALWQDVLARATAQADALEHLQRHVSGFCSSELREDVRIEAVCNWFDALAGLFPEGVPLVLRRLALGMVNAQFCWPLQVAHAVSGQVGIVLPLYAWMQPWRSNADHTTGRVWTYCAGNRYIPPSDQRGHGFDQCSLVWDDSWNRSMQVGLDVGKDLWASQTGRLDDPQERQRWRNASLCVEFTDAADIVQAYFPDAANPLELSDRSAEAYWTQVVLGLLLPARRVPLGVATGTVEARRTGEYVLGPVDERGLVVKLKYASQSGFMQKMVLPRAPETARAVEEAILDTALRDDLLEANLCSSVRDAADALQVSGWRRAIFLGAPEVRDGFTQLTRDLFELQQAGLDVDGGKPPSPERGAGLVATWKRANKAISLVAKLDLCSDQSAVKFVPASFAPQRQLGQWLASMDHRIRGRVGAASGPGLGILCVRTRSGESSMRFWTNVFELLQGSDELMSDFQFGTLDQSSQALARLLNNFPAHRGYSRIPAPDLLVIVDDAGLTQAWGNGNELRTDERGSLLHLLNTVELLRMGRNPTLANLLEQRDDRRAQFLRRTRVIVIYPPGPLPLPDYSALPAESDGAEAAHEAQTEYNESAHWNEERPLVDALRVFQSGFSVHAARSVLLAAHRICKRDEPSWIDVTTMLQRLRKKHLLRYGRGEYYFALRQRQLPIDPAILHDADLHEAAGLAFAPIIARGKSDGTSRRLAMSTNGLREAAWHFQKVYAYAKTRDQYHRARQHLALLGFVLPVRDWDTVRTLTYDKVRYGRSAFLLGRELIEAERERQSTPHPIRLAQLANAAAQALVDRTANAHFASDALETLASLRSECDVAGAGAARIMLDAEEAYFLLRLRKESGKREWEIDPTLLQGADRLRQILEEDQLEPAVRSLTDDKAVDAKRSNYPLQHGWLLHRHEEIKAMDPRSHGGWQYLYAACATDRNASPESWAMLMAELPPHRHPAQVQACYRALQLWHYSVTDKIAFAQRLRRAAGRAWQARDQARQDQFRTAAYNARGWVRSGLIRKQAAEMLRSLVDAFEAVRPPRPSSSIP